MRTLVALLITLSLLISGVAVNATSGTTTYYQLDTGVVFIWKNSAGVWQKGIGPGSKISSVYGLDISKENDSKSLQNVKVSPYRKKFFDDIFGKGFKFNGKPNFAWNANSIASNKDEYDDFYLQNSVTNIIPTNNYDDATGKLIVNWTANLLTSDDIILKSLPTEGNEELKKEVKTINVKGQLEDYGPVDGSKNIYAMMGVTEATVDPVIKNAMESMYPVGGQSSKVEGYLYFVPTIIQYDLSTPLPTLHVTHHQDYGTPLNTYDYDLPLEIGTHTIEATEIFNREIIGSRIDYGTAPTTPIEEGVESVTVTADGTVTDIYLEYYYKTGAVIAPPTGDTMDPDAVGWIQSDPRGVDENIDSEEFNVFSSIPTSEDLYGMVRAKEYIYEKEFLKETGTLSYPISVTKTWNLTWQVRKKKHRTVSDGNGGTKRESYYVWRTKSATETKSGTITIKRPYSYWYIEKYGMYGLNFAILKNGALPKENATDLTGQTTLVPYGYTPPTTAFTNSKIKADHIQEAFYDTTTIQLTGSMSGGKDGRPSPPSISSDDSAQSAAESRVGTIKVKNDDLKVNNKTIMDGSWITSSSNDLTKTEEPIEIPTAPQIGNDILYQSELTIPDQTYNGFHGSSGNITYRLTNNLSNPSQLSKIEKINQTISTILEKQIPVNDIQIHTPVLCQTQIEDLSKYNQRKYTIETGERTVAITDSTDTWKYSYQEEAEVDELILDQTFTVTIPNTGTHKDYRGYKTRDYGKYIKEKQIRFPFDIYIGQTMDLENFRAKKQWITIYQKPETQGTSVAEDFTFYLPPWATEGKYNVLQRVLALNDHTGSDGRRTGKHEEHKNLEKDHYLAVDTKHVEIIGRLYNLKLTDIKDPNWNPLFWINNTTPTKYYFESGTKNRLGQTINPDKEKTMPIIMGSNPNINNLSIKPGYELRFTINTIGNLHGKKDLIKIKPKFYHITEDGGNRQEVDLYYHDQENQQYFIRIGSNRDKKWIKYSIGDPQNGLPETYLKRTASILYRRDQITTMTEEAYQQLFKRKEVKIGKQHTFYSREETRIYKGPSEISGYEIPQGVDPDQAEQSKQGWLIKYYLPNNIFPCEKDLDILAMSRTENGGPGYLDETNQNWLKEGYIIVNFDIETIINNDQDHARLSYGKATNMNEWDLEDYQNQKQVYTDTEREYQLRKSQNSLAKRTVTFNFEDGDIGIFHLDKKASDDYGGYGTH